MSILYPLTESANEYNIYDESCLEITKKDLLDECALVTNDELLKPIA